MIIAKDVSKIYERGREKVYALKDLTVEIGHGEMVGILGPSGSGKTTLMNLIGLLDVPDAGSISIEGREACNISRAEMVRARRELIGFVFQYFFLVPSMTALQNVMLPMYFSGKKDLRNLAAGLLEQVGLAKRLNHLPSQMSGGEMQRVAIARALANDPSVILADEPTGNLDSGTAKEIFNLFRDINSEGKTVILITHNDELAAALPRIITLRDGRLFNDVRKDECRGFNSCSINAGGFGYPDRLQG